MALRAFISLRQKGETALKRRGDVLCLKLADGPVSRRERREFLIVDGWVDTDKERELLTQKWTVGPNPVLTHPYAEFDQDGNITSRSTRYVDISGLSDRADLLDNTKEVAPKQTRDVSIRERTGRMVFDERSLREEPPKGALLVTTTSTIKPDGTGDYTTLQAWEDALTTGDQHAECYSGGSLGNLLLNDADPDSVYIYGAAGHRPGFANRGTNGVAYSGAITIQAAAAVYPHTIRYLRIGGTIGGTISPAVNGYVLTVEYNQFAVTGGAVSYSALLSTASTVESTCTIRGNVIYASPSTTSVLGITSTATNINASGSNTVNFNVHRNTVLSLAGANTLLAGVQQQGSQTAGTTAYNANISCNVVLGAGTADFRQVTLSGSPTFNNTFANNASSDGTADDFGGSGALVNQLASRWFRNPTSDLRLRVNSPGINAGTAVSGFTADMEGTAIPTGTAPEIGAQEYIPIATGAHRRRARSMRLYRRRRSCCGY